MMQLHPKRSCIIKFAKFVTCFGDTTTRITDRLNGANYHNNRRFNRSLSWMVYCATLYGATLKLMDVLHNTKIGLKGSSDY